jgi:general secretion pathway protein K
MRRRNGVALLAALWLIVAIAIVVLQFSLVANERRQLGLQALDRGRYRAIAAGALSTMQARLEYDLRQAQLGGRQPGNLRSSDPLLGIDSLYSGPMLVDSMLVDVVAADLGMTVNVNSANEQQLTLLFGFILSDGMTGARIARAIMDWRDTDDNPRPDGAERTQYIDNDMLVLPTNSQFRDVDDLVHVYGMTPEILEAVRPYLTVVGNQTPNVNTAPEAVLRSVPRMTDLILNQIFSLRSAGRRIQNINEIANAVGAIGGAARGGGGRGNPQQAIAQAMQESLAVSTNQFQFTFYVSEPGAAQPTKLVAGLSRAGQQVNVAWQQW